MGLVIGWHVINYGMNIKHFILYFHMSDEVFQKIRLLIYNGNQFCRLTALNESITFVLHHSDKCPYSYKKWIIIIDEFGPNGTWKNLLMIGPIQGFEIQWYFGKTSLFSKMWMEWHAASILVSKK